MLPCLYLLGLHSSSSSSSSSRKVVQECSCRWRLSAWSYLCGMTNGAGCLAVLAKAEVLSCAASAGTASPSASPGFPLQVRSCTPVCHVMSHLCPPLWQMRSPCCLGRLLHSPTGTTPNGLVVSNKPSEHPIYASECSLHAWKLQSPCYAWIRITALGKCLSIMRLSACSHPVTLVTCWLRWQGLHSRREDSCRDDS